MRQAKPLRLHLVATFVLVFACIAPAASHAEKLGILFIDAGEQEDYGARWLDGYFDHLFPFLPPGFFAGRTGWEGDTCYSHIHFADAAESVICQVPEGTPIDIFCQPHPEYEGYDSETGLPIVHGMFRESFLFGDDTFRGDCYDDGVSDDPVVMFTLLGSETVNPYNTHPWGFDHLGAHVDDPDGPGIGIADFIEVGAFGNMHKYYYT